MAAKRPKQPTSKRTSAKAGGKAKSSAAAGKHAAPAPRPAKAAKGSGKPKAKKAAIRRGAAAQGDAAAAPGRARGAGRGAHLVIVESPAKAKTINKYLGDGFIVQASVGHIRDLPSKAPKGSKQPVPGVDLERDFRPTYVVLPGKAKTVADLKRAAKTASDVWFATDLDREGEAIAWHLAQELGVDPRKAKRVVFNAITRAEVEKAFSHPHPIDEDKVNAQQARRILDRIVGYQVSPLLWKKVARGLSAGRVQSVAVRLVVEREREIRSFVPDESWRIGVRLALDPKRAPAVAKAYAAFLATRDDKGRPPSGKARQQWTGEHEALAAELWELGGKRFDLGCSAADPVDLSAAVREAAAAVGLRDPEVTTTEDPTGRGPARFQRVVSGALDPGARYRVSAVETKRSSTRASAPFITSSLQIAAANQLGFAAQRTMRVAQGLYEGVEVPGEGRVGLITYMRTDSTHISAEALTMARDFVRKGFGAAYLPSEPNVFSSSNKDAQEAHEAIRPTEVARRPEELRGALSDEQYKLYDLVWRRFVASQMTPAQWDATAVSFERSDRATGAVLRATGRVLAFDGFYRVLGVPNGGDEQTLPSLERGAVTAPFSVEPEQRFSSPPPRYSEASLVKTLESEGIGRPSTYASIISVIQERKYVEQVDRRFLATDLGEIVTDKLVEAFPGLMDVGYTRQMEAKLDAIEESHADWVSMLHEFYGAFTRDLEHAHEELTHAKAEILHAPYKCPECGARTSYRFGKNGRFLSCTRYPDCVYSAPIDREGRPVLPERVDIVCPVDGSAMELRTGRFGPFLAAVDFPRIDFVLNLDRRGAVKLPMPPPLVVSELECPRCKSALNLRRGKRGPWLGCSAFPKCRGRLAMTSLPEAQQKKLERDLVGHEKAHPQPVLKRADGRPITEGTPVASLLIPGGFVALELHPEAQAEGVGRPAWLEPTG